MFIIFLIKKFVFIQSICNVTVSAIFYLLAWKWAVTFLCSSQCSNSHLQLFVYSSHNQWSTQIEIGLKDLCGRLTLAGLQVPTSQSPLSVECSREIRCKWICGLKRPWAEANVFYSPFPISRQKCSHFLGHRASAQVAIPTQVSIERCHSPLTSPSPYCAVIWYGIWSARLTCPPISHLHIGYCMKEVLFEAMFKGSFGGIILIVWALLSKHWRPISESCIVKS